MRRLSLLWRVYTHSIHSYSSFQSFHMSRSLGTFIPQNFELFGKLLVPKGEKQMHVIGVFDSVAKKYDLMNDLMSGRLHRLWKDEFVFDILRPSSSMRILDVAGGTGDIAFRIFDAMRIGLAQHLTSNQHRVVVCDINESMLRVGIKRAENLRIPCHSLSPVLNDAILSLQSNPGIAWCVGNAESLPFEANEFDAYTISFGLRNVPNMELSLSEAFRVLKIGGRFLCMEFSPLDDVSFLLRDAYGAYLNAFIPASGAIITGDRGSYQYLSDSILGFPSAPLVRQRIINAGFKCSSSTSIMGGIVHIHSGYKI